MSDTPTRRTPRAARAAIAVVLATALAVAALPAVAQSGFTVTVRATSQYGNGPNWGYAFTPALPAGATVEGNASCADVVVNNRLIPIVSIEEELGGPLPVGTYNLRNCSVSQGFPLVVITAQGVRLPVTQAVANAWRVSPTGSEVTANVAVNTQGPTVGFSAAVRTLSGEDGYLADVPLEVSWQTSSGIWTIGVCADFVTRAGGGLPVATCTVTGALATEFVQGTGVWTISYGGGANIGPSSATGRWPGAATDPETAARNFEQWIADQPVIDVTPVYYPPGCEPKELTQGSQEGTNVSIIGVSLGQLDCTQIQILKYVTIGVMVASAVVSGVGGVILAGKEAAFQATLQAAVQAAMAG